MQKVKYNQPYKGKKAGETDIVSNNEAHFIVDSGSGVLITAGNKMMYGKAIKKKKIKTKKVKRHGAK